MAKKTPRQQACEYMAGLLLERGYKGVIRQNHYDIVSPAHDHVSSVTQITEEHATDIRGSYFGSILRKQLRNMKTYRQHLRFRRDIARIMFVRS